jgi:hypothetical protein
MMRARLLKPGFFTNEELARLPVRARLLFAGLWCLADREGRLEDRPERIGAAVFPYERINVARLIQTLADARFVKRYECASSRYIVLPQFCTHQHPHPREAPSLLPPPPTGSVLGAAKAVPSPAVPVLRSGTSEDQDQEQGKQQRAHARHAFAPLSKIAHDVLATIDAGTLDARDAIEELKCRAAQARIPYDAQVITKALSSADVQRRRHAGAKGRT